MNEYYLGIRDEYIKNKCQDKFGRVFRRVPKINLVLSGGGYRAAICSLALLMALRDYDLLDYVRSIASLSGSSWLVASWMTYKLELEELKKILREKMKYQLMSSIPEIVSSLKHISDKYQSGHLISLVDIWGAAIGNVFLPRSDIKLSDLCYTLIGGNYPFPTFAAIIPMSNQESRKYEWLEFTPANVTFLKQRQTISVKYINNVWKDGQLVQVYPEENLATYLGIFGSAFCANFEDIQHICNTTPYRYVLFQTLGNLMDRFQLRHYRLTCGQIRNPFYSSYNLEAVLPIFDAGIDFNYPILSALFQQPDIIFVCDATDEDRQHTLEQLFNHIRPYNFSLPPLPEPDKRQEAFFCPRTSSYEPDFFYLPNNLNFSTFKLKYDENEFDQLFESFYTSAISFIPLLKKIFHHRLFHHSNNHIYSL